MKHLADIELFSFFFKIISILYFWVVLSLDFELSTKHRHNQFCYSIEYSKDCD